MSLNQQRIYHPYLNVKIAAFRNFGAMPNIAMLRGHAVANDFGGKGNYCSALAQRGF